MKDKVYYYNRNGILQLTLNEYPYWTEPRDLFNWSWGFNEQFGHINTFRRAKESYELTIVIDGDYPARHNDLCDIFNADVLANEPGYLLINGWKLPCYITEAEHDVVFDTNRQSTFAVRAINSTWIRENTETYNGDPSGGSTGEDLGRDYIYWVEPTVEYEDEGSIVEIDNPDSNLEVTSLSVSLEPIQSLNGYDKPWSGGNGKNKCSVTELTNIGWASVNDEIKSVLNSLPSGTYTFSFDLKVTEATKTGAWQYGAVFLKPSGGITKWENVSVDPSVGYTGTFFVTFSISAEAVGTFTAVYLYGCGSNGQGTMGWATLSKIQLESGSIKTDFAPYSNICPISGRTECDTYVSPTTSETDAEVYTTTLGRTVYGGTLEQVGGSLTETYAYVDLSTLSWTYSPTQKAWYNRTIGSTGVFKYNNVTWLSDKWNPNTWGARTTGDIVCDGSKILYCLTEDNVNTPTGHICYKLATPQTYQLTETQINLITGHNYVWSSVSDIDIKYQTRSVAVPARGYNYGYSTPESHYASIDLAGSGNGFEAVIYGPQVNPTIYLNNQPVKVNVTLDATQRLRIVSNGSVKTIEILEPNGASTDAFVFRDKENTPFLTLGQHTDLTFGQIRFDFKTIERRSQPTWN